MARLFSYRNLVWVVTLGLGGALFAAIPRIGQTRIGSTRNIERPDPVAVESPLVRAGQLVQQGGRREWCQTQAVWDAKGLAVVAGPACPTQGICDDPTVRDSWIPGPTTPVLSLNLHFNIFANNDGSNPASTQAEVDAQMVEVNGDYLEHNIQFCYTTSFINDSTYRSFADAEEVAMKTTYAQSPATTLNIYVVTVEGGFSGVGTFPWDPVALTAMGGIIMDAGAFGATDSVLTHEIGHCIGLWHTHHGVSEVAACSACYERADGAAADFTGDYAGDTDPTPTNFNCSPPGGTDACSATPWGPTSILNFMGYSGEACWSEFSAHQSGRMHCWVDSVLSSWTCLDAGLSKFAQYPDGTGEALESDVDLTDTAPNAVHADDFVSDGRPTIGVRWWGSNLSLGSAQTAGATEARVSDKSGTIDGRAQGYTMAPNPTRGAKPVRIGNSNDQSGQGGVALAGGDTCALATSIASLPYADAGTTCGFADNYDEICPFNTPGSEDVVYSYTATADGTVDISLCGNTAYDSKLYVYKDVCGTIQSGTQIACSDDQCATPSLPDPWASSVSSVFMEAGSTYYIIVDGYGGDCGTYTLNISAPCVPTPAGVCLFANSDFEGGGVCGWTLVDSGTGGWVTNDGALDPGSPDGPIAPCGGAYAAITDPTGPGVRSMFQDVTIPAAPSATLRWSDIIRNHGTSFVNPSQAFRVEIRNPSNGALLSTVYSTQPGDPLFQPCTARCADMSAYAGQTVRVSFVAEDSQFFFNAHVDDACVTTNDVCTTGACCEAGTGACLLNQAEANCEAAGGIYQGDGSVICTTCPPIVCGDNIVGVGEQCDPPDGVFCDGTCQFIPNPPIDGWLVSFHEPLSKVGSAAEPLGLYFCDSSAVIVSPTSLGSCDARPVREYFARLDECCLMVANVDTRSSNTPAQIATFDDESCLAYDLDIQAVTGVKYFVTGGGPGVCDNSTITGSSASIPYWGWHTSSTEGGSRSALRSAVTPPGTDWMYGPWVNITPACGLPNMAFELVTDQLGGGDCNENGTPDVCEVGADCQPDGIPDFCQLAGNDGNSNNIPDECDPSTPIAGPAPNKNRAIGMSVPQSFGAAYERGDGFAEDAIGVNDGATGQSFGWANRFTNSTGGPITLAAIEVAFGVSAGAGGVAVGNRVDGVVWIDAAATGNMVNAVKAAQWILPGGVHAVNGTFGTFTIPGGVVVPNGADFYVGVGDVQSSLDTTVRFPAAIDLTPPSEVESWAFFHATLDVFDPDVLAGQNIGTIDALSAGAIAGNWLIRARLQPPPTQTALRVTMPVLQLPIPANPPSGPPQDFSAYETPTCTAVGELNGCARWVGPPNTFREAQGVPALGTYRAARLQCTPYYHDWSVEAPFHVVGAEIMPSSTYLVESFASACAGSEDTCPNRSTALTLATSRYGDVATPFNPPGPAAQPDALDVVNLVNKFRNLAGAPLHVSAQLQANLPELNADVNALDITQSVDAFRGKAYPFSGPCPCPSAVTCNATPCTSPTPCGTGTCVRVCSGGSNDGLPCVVDAHCPSGTCPLGGFCRDRCGRCSP